MKKILICLLMLLICVLAVDANPQMSGWGFGGYQFNTLLNPQTIWSSNLRLDAGFASRCNDSFIINQTIDNYRMPLIMNPNPSASFNEMYLFTSTGINVFDYNFAFICSYNLVGWNGTLSPFLHQNGNRNYFAYLSQTGTDWNINLLNRSSSCFTKFKTINITDNSNYTGSVAGGKNGLVYAWTTDYNLSEINVVNDNQTTYPSFRENLSFVSTTIQPIFDTDFEISDYNNDGFDDVLLAGAIDKNSGDVQIGIFDGASKTWTSNFQADCANAGRRESIGTAIIGSFTRYIILQCGGATSEHYVRIYDFGGTLKLAVNNAAGNGYYVADINRDGKNEFGVRDTVQPNQLNVYDESFTQKLTIKNHICSGASNGARIASSYCGFAPITTILSIPTFGFVGIQGLMYVNDTSQTTTNLFYLKQDDINGQNLSSCYPLLKWANNPLATSSLYGDMNIPVALSSKTMSDIFLMGMNGNPSSVIFSHGLPPLCGNDVCDSGETIVTCPEDCTPALPTDAVLTSVTLNPCNTQIVKLNSTIRITAKAETADNANVNILVDYCSNCALGCEQTAQVNNLASGQSTDIDVIANCTGQNNLLNVEGTRSDGLQSDPNKLGFTYDINELSGQVYGDSSCSTIQPLITQAINVSTELNKNSNSVKNFVDTFGVLTGLGSSLWYLIIMLIYAIAVPIMMYYFIASQGQPFPVMLTTFLEIFGEVLLLIIGTFLGFINVGVVIVIVVIASIFIALWIRNKIISGNEGKET